MTLHFNRPGQPTDNRFAESFNGRFRDECLDTRWFLSLEDARTNRGLEAGLQREPASHRPGAPDAPRVCLPNGPKGRLMKSGTSDKGRAGFWYTVNRARKHA